MIEISDCQVMKLGQVETSIQNVSETFQKVDMKINLLFLSAELANDFKCSLQTAVLCVDISTLCYTVFLPRGHFSHVNLG